MLSRKGGGEIMATGNEFTNFLIDLFHPKEVPSAAEAAERYIRTACGGDFGHRGEIYTLKSASICNLYYRIVLSDERIMFVRRK